MHIKNIIISQFRSYREQSFTEELSQSHNVIVGRNGSGKSNFFAAVQFVLSEKFANLRPADRKELVHVGAGRPGFGVFVEIVFDNSDGRFVIPGRPEDAEVRIRRTVGLKQDDFRVNDRKFSAAEVRQLLESSGFSSSNPYYIVEQGKIVNLASMKEEERYQLIKDVAGTKVYESRRAESEQLLEETAVKHDSINEAIQQLTVRLKDLEAETSELREFQETDKKRKSLEFCIFNSEVLQAKEQLDKLDLNWESNVGKTNATHEEEQKLEKEAAQAELAAVQCAKRLDHLEQERKSLDKERASLISRRAIADLNATDAQGASIRDKQEKAALDKEAQELQKVIDTTRTNFTAKTKALAQKSSESDKLNAQLQTAELRLEVLQAKRGRKRQFTTKADRDVWINEEIKRNDLIITSNKKEIERVRSEIQEMTAALTAIAKDRQESTKKIGADQSETSLAAQQQRRTAAIAKRDKLNLERRKLWQQINDQESIVRRLTEDNDHARQRLEKATRFDIRQGLASLEESLNEINDPKLRAAVHGQLISLINVESAFMTAVEVTAGNALFNVVVDSFDVSAKLLDHMNKKKKPGRVTFFPLDTCKPVNKEIPTTNDYSSLLSHIQFNKKFKNVMGELFGRTAVVSNLDVGAAVVKDLDCDVVTADGDQFNRRGGITGGYNDKRNQKLSAFTDVKTATDALGKEKSVLDALCQTVAMCEQSITRSLEELEQMNSQEVHDRNATDGEREQARVMEDRATRHQQQKEQLEKSEEMLNKNTQSIAAASAALRDELKTDFKQGLSAEEEAELETRRGETVANRATAALAQAAATQLSMDVQLLDSTLRHLTGRLQAVRDRIAVLTRAPAAVEAQYAKDVASLEEEIKLIDERISIIEKNVDQCAVDRKKFEEKCETLRRRLVASTTAAEEEKDQIDRVHNQRALLLQKKEDAQSKIRKLGVIPADADKYAAFSLGKMMHTLKGTNEEMKKYAHVNKKAIDHYTITSETRNELSQQRAALVIELASINTLMDHLDQKKGEAIERTYKHVQFEFENVFKELVSADGCSAELQLVKNPDKKATDPYVAVRIRVSFGHGSSTSELAQLSGGQKSLVALALIFAIQRCDPAPFYLFDEIDAALDAEYRTSVAAMIKRQATQCQFITATFKTEMLQAADKVLGIFFHNKVSRIQTISLDEGMRLLKQAQQEDRTGKRPREEAEAQQ